MPVPGWPAAAGGRAAARARASRVASVPTRSVLPCNGSRLSCVAHHRPAAASAWQASARLRPSSNLCYPPAQANEKEAPVLEELRRLPLDGVADELEGPPDHEQAQRHRPEPAHEQGRDKQRERGGNEGNANGVAEAVHRVLMAECVLRNPVGHRTIAEHVLSSKRGLP